MTWPPPYPRVPHMPPASGASRDDLVLGAGAARTMLTEPVFVEEKLDGANVMLWRDEAGIQAATRAGPGGRDRAGQLGPLRAWVAQRTEDLGAMLANGSVLYAEWLWLHHSVRYDAMPETLIALDLFSHAGGFAPVDDRNRACSQAGLRTPPPLFHGLLLTRERLDGLLTTSKFGQAPAEGLVIRLAVPRPGLRLAKVVAPHFSRRPDSSWSASRERNVLMR